MHECWWNPRECHSLFAGASMGGGLSGGPRGAHRAGLVAIAVLLGGMGEFGVGFEGDRGAYGGEDLDVGGAVPGVCAMRAEGLV